MRSHAAHVCVFDVLLRNTWIACPACRVLHGVLRVAQHKRKHQRGRVQDAAIPVRGMTAAYTVPAVQRRKSG